MKISPSMLVSLAVFSLIAGSPAIAQSDQIFSCDEITVYALPDRGAESVGTVSGRILPPPDLGPTSDSDVVGLRKEEFVLLSYGIGRYGYAPAAEFDNVCQEVDRRDGDPKKFYVGQSIPYEFSETHVGYISGNIGRASELLATPESLLHYLSKRPEEKSEVLQHVGVSAFLDRQVLEHLDVDCYDIRDRFHLNVPVGDEVCGPFYSEDIVFEEVAMARQLDLKHQLCLGGSEADCYDALRGIEMTEEFFPSISVIGFIEQACDTGNGEMCNLAGLRHSEERLEGAEMAKAQAFYEKGCDHGIQASCARLPGAITNQLVVDCEGGEALACMFALGTAIEEEDLETAYVVSTKACELGESDGCSASEILRDMLGK